MRKLIRRVWHALRRRRWEAELAEEMAYHRERVERECEAGGLTPEQAAAATRRALGSVALAREQARDVWIAPSLQDIAQDVRFAARLLAKDRRFTAAVVLALGLGIGANNTVFTLVNTIMLRDMPFDRADRLVALGTRDAKGRGAGVSYADYVDWSMTTRTFSGLSAVTHAGGMVLRDDRGAPQRLRGQFVSANTFQVLRRAPIIGRDFLPSDERPGAPPVVMLGYDVWRARYDGDPSVIGRTVFIDDVPSIVVGVMPEGFAYSFTSHVWQPLSVAPRLDRVKRDARGGLEVVGRLIDDTDRTGGQAELDGIAAQLARAYPETNAGVTPTMARLNENFVRFNKPLLMTLMGAVAFVLLIACANVANLLLARAVARGREMAIRASLGATRWRLARQLLIECLLLALLAGALGLVFSLYGVRFLGTGLRSWEVEAPAEANMPYWVDLSMNWLVFAFLSGVCLVTSLVFGVVPAWFVSRTNTNALLKEGSRGTSGSKPAQRLTSAFIVAEIALTLILLTGAGLLTRSFLTVYYADYAIDTSNLAVMRLALPPHKYRTPEERARFLASLDARLASLAASQSGPVASAVIASDTPFSFMGASRQVTIDGRPPADANAPRSAAYVYASDRYFATLGLAIVRGRALADDDDLTGREGVVINERFAATFFPNEDPIGRRIRLAPAARADAAPGNAAPASPAGGAGPSTASNARGTSAAAPTRAIGGGSAAPWLTIVGIARNTPRVGPTRTPEPMAYVPLRAEAAPGATAALIVRTGTPRPAAPTERERGSAALPERVADGAHATNRGERDRSLAALLGRASGRRETTANAGGSRPAANLAAVAAPLREAVRALDPDLPLYSVETIDAVVARGWSAQRLIGGFLGALALIALVLATVGLYAVTAHGVARRTQEIGIRMALGARAGQVVWLFARRTLVQLGIGLAIGSAGALAVGRLLQALLVETAPRDTATLVTVSLLLVTVASAAASIPARHAARLEPLRALRDD